MQSHTLTAALWPKAQQATARDDTKRPTPKGGPVFIYDAVAPVQGSTLLHLLWQRWDDPSED